MASEKLQVVLELVSGQYKREATSAATATGKLGDEAEHTTTSTGRLTSSIGDMGSMLKGLAATAAVAGTIKFLKDANEAAVGLAESVNATEKVFGEAADQISLFGDQAAQMAGLSKREFNELATLTGSLLTNMGYGLSDAASESVNLTQRAADMASVFNVDVSEALTAINSGLRGETEPLRRFGVQLSDTTIRAKAVEMGLAETSAEVTAHGRALAAVQLVYDQTSKLQGDFADTSQDQANATRIMAAEWENFKATIGGATIPAITGVVRALSGAVEVAEDFVSIISGDTGGMRIDEAFKNIGNAADADKINALADSLLHAAKGAELTTAHFLTMASAAGLSSDQFADFRDLLLAEAQTMDIFQASSDDAWKSLQGIQTGPELLAELEAALDGAAAAAETEAAAAAKMAEAAEWGEILSRRLTDAQAAQTSQTQALYQAQLDYTNSLIAAANPIMAAVTAISRYDRAQLALQTTQADTTATEKEVAAAQLEVAKTALEAQAALEGLGAGDLDDGLNAIAQALGVGKTEARELLETLNILDGKQITTVIKTNYVDMTTSAGMYAAAAQGRALGGPVTPDTMYRVGERGPEWFIPHSSGQIVPVSGREGNVTVNVAAPTTDPAGVADAIAWRMRTAGI
jgi:hypothetical protein